LNYTRRAHTGPAVPPGNPTNAMYVRTSYRTR